MKKLFFCLTLPLVCGLNSSAQTPLEVDSYIWQTTTAQNPATSFGTLYKLWKYDSGNQTAGSFGYTSNNGSLQLYNGIGDVNIHSQVGILRLYTSGAERVRVVSNGNVGIGTAAPAKKLQVEGEVSAKVALWLRTNSVNSTEIIMEKPNLAYYSISSNNNGFFFYNRDTQKKFFYADAQDNIGIGTENTHGYKLAVAGSVLAEKVKVKLQANWPDYVFESSYQLPSIPEMEAYIKTHKHLPGVPSAADVAENGLDLGNNQAALLKKIEELTLIVIDQHKKLEEQEKRLKALEKKNK